MTFLPVRCSPASGCVLALPSRLFAIALLTLSCLAPGPATAQRVVDVDRIIAIVNDDVIVYSELLARVATIRSQLRTAGTTAPPPDVLEKQVLERLILDRLQIQVATKTGARVDEETLNDAVGRLAAENNLSLGEFRDILERDGYDFATFREEIRSELLMSRVRQRQVSSRVTVTDREVKNFLAAQAKRGAKNRDYRLGHVLIALPEAASPEDIAAAKERAEETLQSLRDGADFAQTAAAASDGQQAFEGGDLGWRKETQLPSLFAKLVPDMKHGDVSDVIRNASGFHIIRLNDVRGEERYMVEETQARHILLRTNDIVTEADVQRRLGNLRERIVNGESFSDLAQAHSDDKGSAVKGGELGWLAPGDTVPPFEQAMNALGANEVSEPFQSQFGWHIVQVLERRTRDSTEEVRKGKARQQIRQRKIEEEMQSWLRQLRDEAFVEFRLDE